MKKKNDEGMVRVYCARPQVLSDDFVRRRSFCRATRSNGSQLELLDPRPPKIPLLYSDGDLEDLPSRHCSVCGNIFCSCGGIS